MTTPFQDITVVCVDGWMAAPSATAILADLGANVIKVEPLGGDPARKTSRPPKVDGPLRNYDCGFDVINRGKRSIALDLNSDEGLAILRRLVADARVFVCNLLTPRQKKLGLDPDSVLAVNPRIVHATITGYGTVGPEAWRPGYDATAFFGRTGLYDASRDGDDGVVPMARPAQGDHTSGLALLCAILAGLRVAERTGKGQVVETSLYETSVWTQAIDFAATAVDLAPVPRRTRYEALQATANRYPCGDGKWVVLYTLTADAFEKLCRAIGRESWMDDPRLQTPRGRYQHMSELVDKIDAVLATKTRDEWGEIFDRVGLIWGPVLSLDEVPRDQQARAVGLFPEMEHPEFGPYPTVKAPIGIANADIRPRGPAPAVGEHSRAILKHLGYTATKIQQLIDDGVIGVPKA